MTTSMRSAALRLHRDVEHALRVHALLEDLDHVAEHGLGGAGCQAP
jgi:hypothetical protein